MSNRVSAVCALLNSGVAALQDATVPPLPVDAVFPYATVTEVFNRNAETLDGDKGASRSVIQVNVWGKVYDSTVQVRDACMDYLSTYAGSGVMGFNHLSSYELYDGERSLHQCILRVSCWWGS